MRGIAIFSAAPQRSSNWCGHYKENKQSTKCTIGRSINQTCCVLIMAAMLHFVHGQSTSTHSDRNSQAILALPCPLFLLRVIDDEMQPASIKILWLMERNVILKLWKRLKKNLLRFNLSKIIWWREKNHVEPIYYYFFNPLCHKYWHPVQLP